MSLETAIGIGLVFGSAIGMGVATWAVDAGSECMWSWIDRHPDSWFSIGMTCACWRPSRQREIRRRQQEDRPRRLTVRRGKGAKMMDKLEGCRRHGRYDCDECYEIDWPRKTSTVYEIPAGWSPEKGAKIMLELAEERAETVTATFNGTKLEAREDMHVEQVLEPLARRMANPAAAAVSDPVDQVPHPAWIATQERDALAAELEAARTFVRSLGDIQDIESMGTLELVVAAHQAGRRGAS